MGISIINTDKAPKAIGPYSQAVKANGFLFTSGQLPMDPAANSITENSIEEQTRRVMQNLASVLNAGGASFNDVVETIIFCTDLNDFQAINAIYAEMMGEHRPARSTVQVAALPKGAKIEIRMVAISRE